MLSWLIKLRQKRENRHQNTYHFPKENVHDDEHSTIDSLGLSHPEGSTSPFPNVVSLCLYSYFAKAKEEKRRTLFYACLIKMRREFFCGGWRVGGYSSRQLKQNYIQALPKDFSSLSFPVPHVSEESYLNPTVQLTEQGFIEVLP